MELWSIVEGGYEEPENEDILEQGARKTLNENRKKDSKALFQIYQAIEMPIYERIAKAENSKQAWEIIKTSYKEEEKSKEGTSSILES